VLNPARKGKIICWLTLSFLGKGF